MKRVLLLLPTTSYRNDDVLAAAKKLGVEIISVANYCHQLAPLWGMSLIQSVPFDQPEVAVTQVLAALGRKPDAVLAVDDSGLALVALLRERLYLPGNTHAAVRLTRDKLAFRRLLQSGGFKGISPDAVESSLRLAHQRLVFEIQADIPVNQARA